jgi:hypothetical protein
MDGLSRIAVPAGAILVTTAAAATGRETPPEMTKVPT